MDFSFLRLIKIFKKKIYEINYLILSKKKDKKKFFLLNQIKI